MGPRILKLDTRQTTMERRYLKYICALTRNLKQRTRTPTS